MNDIFIIFCLLVMTGLYLNAASRARGMRK